MAKPNTQWFTPNRNGTISIGSNNFLVTNSGKFIVTNSGKYIVTNLLVPVPQPSTSWTQSTKNDTSWIDIGVSLGAINNIVDPSGNILVDPSGVQVVDTGRTLNTTPATGWVED